MTASMFADLQQQISSASFMLKLTIPSSLTLLAALFITCNHNNLSSLVARKKEFLSHEASVLLFFIVIIIFFQSRHCISFISADKTDFNFLFYTLEAIITSISGEIPLSKVTAFQDKPRKEVEVFVPVCGMN